MASARLSQQRWAIIKAALQWPITSSVRCSILQWVVIFCSVWQCASAMCFTTQWSMTTQQLGHRICQLNGVNPKETSLMGLDLSLQG